MVVHGSPSTFSDDFFSETTGSISDRFQRQPPDKEGKKLVCVYGPGHILVTKMATMKH